MKFIIIPLLFGIALLSSCNESPTPEENITKNALPDSLAEYSLFMNTLSRKETNCKTGECTVINLHIPVLKGGDISVRSKINEFIDTQVRESLRSRLPEPMGNATLAEMAEAFLKGYDLFVMEFPDTDEKWSMEIRGDSSTIGEDYFTLLLQHDEYLGGAHGSSFKQLQSFSLTTGQPLEVTDRYEPNVLKKLAEKNFRQQHKLQPTSNLNDAGYLFENGIFSLPENMALMPNGVLLVYNSYEVAAYAEGETKILIPYSDLKPNS